MVRFPYRWLPRTFCSNVTYGYYCIHYGIRNLFRWIPIIWWDDDCDWSYLAEIMQVKLECMAEFHKKYGNLVSSNRSAKQMKTCAILLGRLNEDKYWKNAVKRYGESPMAAIHAMNQQKNDQKYLGLIIGKYLNHWWD